MSCQLLPHPPRSRRLLPPSAPAVCSALLAPVLCTSCAFFFQDVRVRAWVPMVGCLLAVPCWIGVVSGTNFYVSLGFLLAEYIVAECWFGPTVTILQEGLPPNVRGVGQGVFR